MAEILSSCLVPMATPSSATISRLDLTPCDLRLLLFPPIKKGLFFHKPESKPEKTIIQHLKTSLSQTLDFFPPLAGRLVTTTTETNDASYYHVECNNMGALFTHTIAPNIHVRDIIDSLHVPSIVGTFFTMDYLPNCGGSLSSHPLLGVQVTELVDGFFVACNINHYLVDGTSFWHFFNSWSEISRGAKIISKLPVFERSFNDFPSLNVPIPIPHSDMIPSEKKFNPGPFPARIFSFGKENMSKLKAKANSQAGTDKISSLQALMAHVWRAVMRSRGFGPAQEVACEFLVSARTRVPLPETYFGNAIHSAMVKTENGKLESNGFGWVALEINKVVGLQTKEEVKIRFEDFIEKFRLFKATGIIVNHIIAVSSSPRHNMYGVDFGWGKPVAVRNGEGRSFDGKITLYPSAEEGGIDMEVCLSPESMAAVESDPEFMEAVTLSKT